MRIQEYRNTGIKVDMRKVGGRGTECTGRKVPCSVLKRF